MKDTSASHGKTGGKLPNAVACVRYVWVHTHDPALYDDGAPTDPRPRTLATAYRWVALKEVPELAKRTNPAPVAEDAPNTDAPAQDVPTTDATPATDAPQGNAPDNAPAPDAPADNAPEGDTHEPDALELIIGNTIREGFALLQLDYDNMLKERNEIAGEIDARISSGKNGAVLKALETTLADIDAKMLLRKNALSNVEQRVSDALRYVRRLADPMSMVAPAPAAPAPRTATAPAAPRTRGVKYGFGARVSGQEVESPTAVASISNLCWYKLAKSRVDDLREAFRTQASVDNLEQYLSNTANPAIRANVACPDGVTREVELRPAAAS